MSEAGTIDVMVNGEPRQVAAGRTVRDMLESLGLHPALVVVEQNREILERSKLGDTPVEAGDVFELVHFVGGG